MKIYVWDFEMVRHHRVTPLRRAPRKTVSQILREAYRLYARDAGARAAVKRCLR